MRIAGALKAHGGEIKVDAPVQRIIVRGGRCRGVALANGDEHHADVVVSNLDPKRTFLKLIDPADLDADLAASARATSRSAARRASSTSRSTACPSSRRSARAIRCIAGDMHFLDSLERYERAYDDWKSGTWSKDPYLDLLIPSLTDPTMAPPGKHDDVGVRAVRAAVKVNGRDWTDADRDAFRETVFDQIARYSPNFRSLVLHAEVRTPRELEDEGRPHRRQHLPGRAHVRPAALQPAVPGLRAISGPGARHVHVRLRHASGRRRDGRAGRQRRARNPAWT